MRLSLTATLLILAGCALAPAPLPVAVAPLVLAPPPPPAEAAAVPAPVTAVAQRYSAAARKEVRAVTDPNVTPEYVRSVHHADRAARAALTILERQSLHPTATALANARLAVGRLDDVLNAPP